MHLHRFFLVGLVLSVGFAPAARGQVVQLPTFRSFSVSTTVSVPDSGAAYLGGVSRYASSRSSRGVPGFSHVPGLGRLARNHSNARSLSSSHAYATATITDHAEMDRRILDEAAARRAPGEELTLTETARRAAYLSRFTAKHSASSTAAPREEHLSLVGAGEDQIPQGQADRQTEVGDYLQRARAAEAAGRLGSARCNYDVVARRGNPAQKQLALRRLAALLGTATDDKLVRGD